MLRALPTFAIAIAACWTGTVPDPGPPPAGAPKISGLFIAVVRDNCVGDCERELITIASDGTVQRNDERIGRITPDQMAGLEREVREVDFFALDDNGQPTRPRCLHVNNAIQCTMTAVGCSDSPAIELSVRRGRQAKTVKGMLCGADTPLDRLNQYISDLVNDLDKRT